MQEVDGKQNRQETSYDTDNRLPLQVTSSCRSIVFGTGEVQRDSKEEGTNRGHDWYVKSELHPVDV